MSNTVTRKEWLLGATQSLSDVSDSSQLDARILLCHVLSISKSHLLAWPDEIIEPSDLAQLNSRLLRRQAGEPIAYITGSTEFWGLEFNVSPAVLVPRPETELVIETVLEILVDEGLSNPTIIDMGTGSGAIAIALGRELSDATITAVDVSEAALSVAESNRTLNGCENVTIYQSDWFEHIDSSKQFDMIVSNPPYVAENDPHLADLTFEPLLALTAANEGMADIERLSEGCAEYLKPLGWLIVEHGYNQGKLARKQFQSVGLTNVRTLKDLANLDRITIGQWDNDANG